MPNSPLLAGMVGALPVAALGVFLYVTGWLMLARAERLHREQAERDAVKPTDWMMTYIGFPRDGTNYGYVSGRITGPLTGPAVQEWVNQRSRDVGFPVIPLSVFPLTPARTERADG